jgi:hypothetical protein
LLRSHHFRGIGGVYLFTIGLIVVTTIHELGHASVWALGFKFHTINIGPLTIVRDHYGHRHVHFDWDLLGMEDRRRIGKTYPVERDYGGVRGSLRVFERRAPPAS